MSNVAGSFACRALHRDVAALHISNHLPDTSGFCSGTGPKIGQPYTRTSQDGSQHEELRCYIDGRDHVLRLEQSIKSTTSMPAEVGEASSSWQHCMSLRCRTTPISDHQDSSSSQKLEREIRLELPAFSAPVSSPTTTILRTFVLLARRHG